MSGDTGGRSGVGDFERAPECSEVEEASLEDIGRVFVSTRSAGMAARVVMSPGAKPERPGRLPIGDHDDIEGEVRPRRGLRALLVNLREKLVAQWRELGAV